MRSNTPAPAKVSGDKPEMNFEDDVYGDVTVYGVLERSKCSGYIHIVEGLEYDDLGLRADGGRVSTAPGGESLASDLLRHSDGSYETSDGRFHVKVGEAMVYRDGSVCTTDATLRRQQGQKPRGIADLQFLSERVHPSDRAV